MTAATARGHTQGRPPAVMVDRFRGAPGPRPASRRGTTIGRPAAGLALALAVLLGLGGCASVRDRVVLLPSADGRPAAVEVTVRETGQRQRLDQPHAALELKGDTLQPVAPDAAAVTARYGKLIEQQPPRPQRFVVRFEANAADRLTADAQPVLEQVKAMLGAMPAPEVVVTGHTDRVGSVEANDRLSLQRAQVVVEILVAAGVGRSSITAVGRGEREPEVPTADEVAEARNRRVEIKLR